MREDKGVVHNLLIVLFMLAPIMPCSGIWARKPDSMFSRMRNFILTRHALSHATGLMGNGGLSLSCARSENRPDNQLIHKQHRCGISCTSFSRLSPEPSEIFRCHKCSRHPVGCVNHCLLIRFLYHFAALEYIEDRHTSYPETTNATENNKRY